MLKIRIIISKYLDVNSLYGKAMSQKLLVGGFRWAGNKSKFDEDFIKNLNEKNDKDIFLKSMFNILKKYMNFTVIYNFNQKEWKLESLESLLQTCVIKWVCYTRKEFKTSTKSWISFAKKYRNIIFNKKALLKFYIGMNTDLTKKMQ